METGVPRFRFALTTGRSPDLGNLRTAIFNWGLARALRGDLILRIEDGHSVDVAQHDHATAEEIVRVLRWLDLEWDEGPDLGGPHAPYFQSERQDGYRQVAKQLAATENAYYGEGSGEERTLYLRLRSGDMTAVADALRGKLTDEDSRLSDPILMHASGRASLLLAEVVDDHEMGITHVVRGQRDRMLSIQQAHLFRILNWDEPTWIHLPAIEDIHGQPIATEITARDFMGMGYLPEALFNYLLLLGWRPEVEILDKWTVRKQLKIEALAQERVIFDWERLNDLNRHYMQRMSDADLTEVARPYLEEAYDLTAVNDAWLERLIGLIRDEMTRLDDTPELAEWALSETFSFNEAAAEVLRHETARPALVRLVAELAQIVLLDEPTAAAILENLDRQFDAGTVHRPIRAALTGRVQGPPLSHVMALLGKDRCMNRSATILRS